MYYNVTNSLDSRVLQREYCFTLFCVSEYFVLQDLFASDNIHFLTNPYRTPLHIIIRIKPPHNNTTCYIILRPQLRNDKPHYNNAKRVSPNWAPPFSSPSPPPSRPHKIYGLLGSAVPAPLSFWGKTFHAVRSYRDPVSGF